MSKRISNIILAIAATVAIAIPVVFIFTGSMPEPRQTEINRSLKLDIKKKDVHIEQLEKKKTDAEKQAEELKKQNDQLQKDLQAKRERQANEAKVAAANQQKAAVANVGKPGNCESYRGIVAKYFPADQINNALLTMSKESSCNPTAVSPTRDHGLMQINEVHLAKVNGNVNALYDPETNIRIAGQIYSGRGWTAWYAVRGILW